jgi:hypothetical protein
MASFKVFSSNKITRVGFRIIVVAYEKAYFELPFYQVLENYSSKNK